MIYRIAILGDFNPAYSTHHALNDSVRSVSALFEETIQFDWIATDVFNTGVVFSKKLYCGLWVAPGSPYKDDKNVLEAIRYARENNIPSLGNCGGFQYMMIEYAKNVCGIEHADHAETSPNTVDPVISKLACSLVEKEEQLSLTGKQSKFFTIIGQTEFPGRYFCSYGLNEKYTNVLQQHGIKFTSVSADGLTRSFELDNHPFYIGTLFQPALTSAADKPNPVIKAFVQAAIDSK